MLFHSSLLNLITAIRQVETAQLQLIKVRGEFETVLKTAKEFVQPMYQKSAISQKEGFERKRRFLVNFSVMKWRKARKVDIETSTETISKN